MAEEIKQVLGFDAGQAIAEIDKLDRKLKDLQGTISSFGTSFTTFNKRAGKTVAALKQIATAAGEARRAFGAGFAQATAIGPTGQQVQAVVNLGNTAKTAQARLQAVGTAAQTMGEKVKSGAKKGQQATQGLTVSFQTMARIISTQLIVRALGGFQRALTESISAAFEFQQIVAEIQTIDPRGAGLDQFGEIAGEVRQLSDAFNADLGDVGKGLYQTISNQISGVGDASQKAATNYEFLSTAIRLSRAGVATVEQSVNLLAGTINAFGEDVGNAARISGQFFRVVELGRTTIRELATSFNTVAPLASELGVTIEELGAAFATITIGGVDTAKAATQIRGTLNALLKPTTEMKDAFADLGVTTGEQLIEVFGFQGALQAVIGTTDETSQSIAKLIPRVRGLTGVLRLVGSGADNFRENLQKIIETRSELLDKKFDIIADTNAFQVEQEFRKLRNFLIDDFGNSVVKVVNEFLKLTGGMENTIQIVQALGKGAKFAVPALAALGLAAAAMGAKAAIAAKQMSAMNRALAVTAAIGAAISLGQFIGNQINDLIEKGANERAKLRTTELKKIRDDAMLRTEIEEASNKLILANFQSHMAGIAKINAQRIKDARKTAQGVRDANEDAFKGVLGASETLEKKLRGQADSRETQARESIDNVRDLEGDLREVQFEQRTRSFNDTQKFFALEQKLQAARFRATREASQAAFRAGDPDAIERVRSAFEEITQIAEDLQGAAKGDKGLTFRADKAAITSIQARITLERQLQRIIAQRRTAEKKAADEVADNNRKLKESLKELITAQDGLFEQGISDDEQNRRFEEFKKTRLGFFETLQQNAQIGARELADFSRVFGERGLAGIVGDELTQTQIKQLVISETALAEAKTDLENALSGAVAAIDIEIRLALEGAGFDVTSQAQVGELVQKAVARKELIDAADREVETLSKEVDRVFADVPDLNKRIIERLQAREAQRGVSIGAVFSPFLDALRKLEIGAVGALVDKQITPEESANLKVLVDQFKAAEADLNFFDRFLAGLKFRVDAEHLRELNKVIGELAPKLQAFEAAQKAAASAREGDFGDDATRDNVIRATEETGKRQAIMDQMKRDAEGTDQAVQDTGQSGVQASSGLDAMTQSVVNTREQVAQLQEDLNGLQAPNVGPVTAATGGLIPGFAKGGLVKYLDRGGFLPRGTDTIPAMLSPGEFVVNARSARRFYSELSAINSGARPIYRQDGGPVSNTSIGDINVTVQNGRSNETTGRDIGRSLRRELRRNTSTL